MLWIRKLFIELANRNNRVFLTLDCSSVNIDGPGKFQTEANNLDFQTCCYNVANDEQVHNEFVSKRINSNDANDRIQFKIIHLKSKANREEKFDATDELRDLTKNDTATTGSKKRARTIFGAGSKSIEKLNAGHGTRSRAKPKFLLV